VGQIKAVIAIPTAAAMWWHAGHFERRYQTKAEQITELEAYLGELKLELQAVEEHLADLRR
jgi:hypothetical protein